MADIKKIRVNSTDYDVRDTSKVSFADAQTLTDAQKANARGNIDAASVEEVRDLKSALNKNKDPLDAVWEIGNITTVDGSEVSRNDCVRTPSYPINASKDLISIFRTDVSVIGEIFINAHFYDERMNYLGSYRPGDSQIQGSCYIDPIKYGEVAFIRFTKLFTNSSDISTTSDTHDIYITDVTSTDSDLYAAQCKEGYEIVSFHVVKGGITGTGIVYDNDYVARSETGVYFPAGSKIVFLKDHRGYQPRIHFFYPNGHKYEGNYNDTGFITNPDEFDYSVCPDGLYAGLSFNDAYGLTLSEKNYREIENICKIVRPVKKINDSYEERIGGNVVGNQNLLQNGMPFVYNVAYWLNDGIYYKEVTEDTKNWSKDNAMISAHLKPGEYGFICIFVANEGTSPDAVAYCIWGEDGAELVYHAARYASNYGVERSFTVSEEQNIYLQFKTYPGESFKVYLYRKPSYLTLKTASGLIESLNIAEDTQYHNIYDQLVEQTILKYDAVTNAGDIGYIWISDLHVNSLYPNRNKALKRQLRACAEIANRTNIKFICIGGDILDREVSHNVIFSLINNLFSGVSASRKPIVILAGNHDDNPYTNPVHLTKSQVKSLFIDMTDVNMIGDIDKCYYYFDEGNYRIICLDMIDYPQGGTYDGMSWWGFSQEQVTWLGDILEMTDKNVILLCHQTLDESHSMWNLGNNGGYTADIRSLINAYNTKTTITLYNHTYDFTATTGKVLFNHAGHAHFDEQYYLESLRAPILVTSCAKETEIQQYDGTELVEGNTYRVVTNETGGHWNSFGWTFQFYPNREIGTQSEATFDVVSVGANTVNVFRVGAGVDRSFNLTKNVL